MNYSFLVTPKIFAQATEAGGEQAPWASYTIFLTVLLVVISIFVCVSLARKGLTGRVFHNKMTGAAEQLYLFLENFALGIIGPHGRKYLPLLATYWLFIFVSNIYGLFNIDAPTANLSINLGLSISAIAYVQYEGIRSNGFGGHLKHFAGPKLFGIMLLVNGMIFLIEIISEAMKMVSLSLRLYGNIHGGHQVVTALNGLGTFHIGGMEVVLPIGGLLLPIKLLTAVVQALVFTLLLSVYLGLVTHHETEDTPKEVHGTEGSPSTLEPVHV